MNEKLVLVGAGSAMFTRGLLADMIERKWTCELALVDIALDALAVAEGLARKMIQARSAGIRLSAFTDRRQALSGATAVICTVGVGGRRAWEQDVFIPRRYGIYQPVGDTTMPGGTSRVMRMAPAMADIARDVLDLCPRALFFNYGNPMSCVCRAVRKATGAEVVGLCHGVRITERYLAGVLGVDQARLRCNAVGMNHLTWFLEARVDGRDVMPDLRRLAAERCRSFGQAPGPREDDQPFSWQLMRLLGAFPAVLDRHVVEFFPHLFPAGRYLGGTLGLDVIGFEKVIEWGDRIFQDMCETASSPKPLPADYFEQIGGEHEQVVEIIDHIRRDEPAVYSVNVPNRDLVANLPPEAVIECPALSTAAGLVPLAQKPLPSGVAGMLATRLLWVETAVEAALEGSRDKFVQALVLDGAVTSLETAEKLADDLLAAHAAYLPQFAEGVR